MDKRKIKSRGLKSSWNSRLLSQSSMTSDSSTSTSGIVSQRISNTDMPHLRKISDASSKNSCHDTDNEKNINTPTSSAKRSHRDDMSDVNQIRKKIKSQQTTEKNKAPSDLTSGPNFSPSSSRMNKLDITITTPRSKAKSIIDSTKKNILKHFLLKAGVVLDENDPDTYTLNEDPSIVVKKMKELLNSGEFDTHEVLKEWVTNWLHNMKYLRRCLNPTNIFISDENKRPFSTSLSQRYTKSLSLIKILFQIPQLQTKLLTSLIQKLNETIVAADKIEDAPWTYQLLQQLRFIGVINDPESLTVKLEELLETSPIWFQRELITFLPDIVLDEQHNGIAEILCRLMEIHNDLTNVILDCITNLSLGKNYQGELRGKMLTMCSDKCNINKIPAIIRFCLNDCTAINSCQDVIRAIRALDLQPLDGDDFNEYYTNQIMIVNAIKMSVMLSSDMANVAALVVNSSEFPVPIDIIILLLLYEDTTKRKKADLIFRQHVKTGHYNVKLLNELYNNYKLVVKDLQPVALRMSSNFLTSDDRMLIDFSSEWFRQQFLIHSNLIHKQREIIEKLILLMGNNNHISKSVLALLCKMTKNENERRLLQAHCNHLRILMEKVEKFNLEETMILNDLLYGICTNSNTISDALQDDLFILLQKQLLCRRDSIAKSKGVAAAVMAIKHLATNPKSCKMAKEIFHKVLKSIKNCPRSQGFFYDKIGFIISDTEDLDNDFLQYITEVFEDEFIDAYMTDIENYSGVLKPMFSLQNSDSDPKMCGIHFGLSKYGGATVPALLRLMGISFMRVNDDKKIDNMIALLGCPVLMPEDLELPDIPVLDHLFYCINWFRELLNIFVTQTDPILQQQVSKRLDNIINLQSDLSNLLTIAELRYQFPACYFHCCPTELPSFKIVEKKINKKGKSRSGAAALTEVSGHGASSSENREKWEIATLLSTKNPMFFRRLDAKMLNFIDISINLSTPPTSTSSSSPTRNIDCVSTSQLCFIIKELIVVFEDDSAADEKFVRDLITLLPKICTKLQIIVSRIESENDNNSTDKDYNNKKSLNKQAFKLLLNFIATVFSWKQFNNPVHNSILRDGLRILAGQINKSHSTLTSCKKLVGESYRYFESLSHVATQISVAQALVDVCRTLMRHSTTFTQQYQNKQAIMAYGFLCLEWPEDRHTGALYKSAIVGLLNNWMDHEPKPLETVTSILEWLPDQAKKLQKSDDKLDQLPSMNKANLHHLILKIFSGLIKGIKVSLSSASNDAKKLELWKNVAENIQGIVSVYKMITTRTTLIVYLRHMPLVLKHVLNSCMPTLERNLRYHPEEITKILKMIQIGTRYLNVVCVHGTEKKDLALTKFVPAAKTILEKLLYSVKAMLIVNNSSTAFWMGNLVNKNLDGQEIFSQTSNSTDETHPSMQNMLNSDLGNIDLSVRDTTDDDLLSDAVEHDNDIDEDGDADDDENDDNDDDDNEDVSSVMDD